MRGAPAICAGCGEPGPATGSYFVSAYPPFDYWTPAALPAYQRAVERPGDLDVPLGLYVHIPFCEKRCDYCYYLSYDERGAEVDHYLEALGRELALYGRAPTTCGRRPAFVYFGGGTPSLLSTARLERLLGALWRSFDLTAAREITFECAPRSVTSDKLRRLRDFGVNRISMGVQQLDDRVLAINGRLHLTADVERAIEAIRDIAFETLNLDLIVGLVGETDETFFSSLERTVALAPESITIYQLEVPHNTPLFRQIERTGPIDLPGWKSKRRRLEAAFARLEDEGYTLRSAYTAVREPRHHAFLYQDLLYGGADLLGMGASSFSYVDGVHQQNVASLTAYLGSSGSDELPLGRAYALDSDERLVRQLVLQLKLGRVDLDALELKLGSDPRIRFSRQFTELESKGLARLGGSELRLTRSGLLRIDRLLQRFYRPEHHPLHSSPRPA